jgi:hypothetical protein
LRSSPVRKWRGAIAYRTAFVHPSIDLAPKVASGRRRFDRFAIRISRIQNCEHPFSARPIFLHARLICHSSTRDRNFAHSAIDHLLSDIQNDAHRAAKAMIAALASAITLIESNTNGVRIRSKKPMSGTTMADTRVAEATSGHSV